MMTLRNHTETILGLYLFYSGLRQPQGWPIANGLRHRHARRPYLKQYELLAFLVSTHYQSSPFSRPVSA